MATNIMSLSVDGNNEFHIHFTQGGEMVATITAYLRENGNVFIDVQRDKPHVLGTEGGHRHTEDSEVVSAWLEGVNSGMVKKLGGDTLSEDPIPPNIAGKKVFLAYVDEDKKRAANLRQDLQSMGAEVIDCTDIPAGASWKGFIRNHILSSNLFVACFSERSQSRTSTYFNEELTQAIEELRRRPHGSAWFIPVLFDNVRVPSMSIGAGSTLEDLFRVELFRDRKDGIERLRRILGDS